MCSRCAADWFLPFMAGARKTVLFGETTEYPMRASTERRGYERQKTCGLRHDAPGIDCDSRAKSLVDG